MQTLLLPAARSGVPPPSPAMMTTSHLHLPKQIPSFTRFLSPPSSSTSFSSHFLPSLSLTKSQKMVHLLPPMAYSPSSTGFASPADVSDPIKLAQVAKRLENTARYFKRFGTFGFWGQLVCTLVAAVILSFSAIINGKITSPGTFYATAGGIAAAFISVFWSFGYLRLSEKLRRTANDPSKAPPRADVVKGLKNGIILNMIGMGSAILGLQATVGSLVAKALTTSTTPYTVAPGASPVLALDVFLVQASANTILSHFFGLVSSLELLRSVTVPTGQVGMAMGRIWVGWRSIRPIIHLPTHHPTHPPSASHFIQIHSIHHPRIKRVRWMLNGLHYLKIKNIYKKYVTISIGSVASITKLQQPILFGY